MGINTAQSQPGQGQPLYPWHETGEKYTWPQLLRLWAAEAASLQPGAAGLFLCDALQRLADEAATWNLATPESHARYRAETEAHEAAYIAALEAETHWDPGDEPEDDPCDPGACGSLLGHPAGDDDFPLQVWLGDPGDDTYAN